MHNYRIAGILATNIFLSGAAFAAMTPYRAIVGVEALGLTNAVFGLVMALNAVGSAFAAVALGWISDKLPDRRELIFICAFMGVVAFTVIWMFQNPIAFISAFCLLVPFGNALFSQSFSYSRAYFDRERPDRSEFIMSLLRTGFTLAWIIVPPVAGWIAAQTSAYAVFAFSAVAHVGCTVMIGLLWLQPGAGMGVVKSENSGAASIQLPKIRISRTHRWGVFGVTLSLAALQLNMVLLPLVIIRDLAGNLGQVGITSAIAAAIEVPVMIGWGYIALRISKDLILAIASATFALYFGLMVFVDSFFQVLLLQGFAAVAIAALLSINISYLQEAIPGRIGLSTSLVDVTRVISVFVAAAIFALNTGDIYAPLMAIAAVLSLCGTCLLLCARHARRQSDTAQD